MALNIEDGRKKYLTVLGLSQDATNDDIKKTYKALALKHHPDKNPDDPNATEHFQKLSQAYYQLTRKYSKTNCRVSGRCPDCGCCYCYESDDDEEDFTDDEMDDTDEDNYAAWFFKKLFIDVFGEYIFKRRFQSRKKPKSQRFSPEEEEEDSFFDFIYKKYREEDDEEIITEEDLRKFHTYDEWIKERDPRKRPNHRTRKARKKFNSKYKSDKPKTLSKKQQLAEQRRREKEMKEIAEQLKIKVNLTENQEKQETSQMKNEKPLPSGTSDAEIFKEVERQLKENRKNELMNAKQSTNNNSDKISDKKNRRKQMKEMKKQVKEEATKNLKKEPEKEPESGKETETTIVKNKVKDTIGTINTIDIDLNQMGNPAGKRQTREKEVKSSILQNVLCGTTAPVSVNKVDKKTELLEHHLKQYNELMKAQPPRHTEKQLNDDKIKEKNRRMHQQHEELMALRGTQDKTKLGAVKVQHSRVVDEEFERMRKEHLRKQHEMERKRNEEEFLAMQQRRVNPTTTKTTKTTKKWYEKPEQTTVTPVVIADPAPPPSRNIWADRFREQEANRVPAPATAEEEEEMLKKVLEMSQITVKQDEERRKYRQQMANKDFIPEQLKKQMEEAKKERKVKQEEKKVDKSVPNWSSVVTSNLPSQDTKQEVKYTDPPKIEMKVLETNYDNLKPNLKIKVTSDYNGDEDWSEEAQNIDISPKIPTTIEKYMSWNKTIKNQQDLCKGDAKPAPPCSPREKLTNDSERVRTVSNGSGDGSEHPYPLITTKAIGKCNEIVNKHLPVNCVLSDEEKGRSVAPKCENKTDNNEDWDLATDEKWGVKSMNVSNMNDVGRNILDLRDIPKHQSLHAHKVMDVAPKPLAYKQRPMKCISKQNYNEQSGVPMATKMDVNHNVSQPENISCKSEPFKGKGAASVSFGKVQNLHSSSGAESLDIVPCQTENLKQKLPASNQLPAVHQLPRSPLLPTPNQLPRSPLLLTPNQLPTPQRLPVSHQLPTSKLTETLISQQNMKTQAQDAKNQNCEESWDDDLIEIPQQIVNNQVCNNHSKPSPWQHQKDNLPSQQQFSVPVPHENNQSRPSPWQHQEELPTQQIPIPEIHENKNLQEGRNIPIAEIHENKNLLQEKYIPIPETHGKNLQQERYIPIPEIRENKNLQQGRIVSSNVDNKSKTTTEENWEDDLIEVDTTDNKALPTASLSNESEKISAAPANENVEIKENVAVDHHRLPVLKNLCTNSNKGAELPTCRLPRLPNIGKHKPKTASTMASVEQKETLPINQTEKEVTVNTDGQNPMVPETAGAMPQDLTGLMANLNMTSAMNMPQGLPPYLMQAYMQFLASTGNNAALGMMPNLANMPLLPGLLPMVMQNPLATTSPVLAYTLQQQQLAAMNMANMAMASGVVPAGNVGLNIPSGGLGVGLNMCNSNANEQQNTSLQHGIENQCNSFHQTMTSMAAGENNASNNVLQNTVSFNTEQNASTTLSKTEVVNNITLHAQNIAATRNEVLHNTQGQSSADLSSASGLQNGAENWQSQSCHTNMKLPFDPQRKKENFQAVQDILNGVRTESLREITDLDPRRF